MLMLDGICILHIMPGCNWPKCW